jgi:hypothetical protein
MKQNQNNIECAPTKQEEGVANCLIRLQCCYYFL